VEAVVDSEYAPSVPREGSLVDWAVPRVPLGIAFVDWVMVLFAVGTRMELDFGVSAARGVPTFF
jgi:hypothetical protein